MLAVLAESALRSLLVGSAVWIGLHLFRVRNLHVHMTCWAVMLVASLAMPLLMHWTTVNVTWAPSVVSAPVDTWLAPAALPRSSAPSAMPVIAETARQVTREPFNWWGLATAIFAGAVSLLMLRLATGLYLTCRIL